MFPFKTKPKKNFVNIGSDESGIIEVVAYNDLTIAEQLEYDEAIADLEKEDTSVVGLIIDLAKEKGLTFEQAQAVITGKQDIKLPQGGNAETIRLEYIPKIVELNAKSLPIQQKKQLIGATIMVRRAIEPINAYLLELKKRIADAAREDEEELSAEIAEYEKQLQALEKWTVEDTKNCPDFRQSTLKVLYEFFLKESNGGVLPEIEEVDEGTIAEKSKTIEGMGKPVAIDVEVRPATNGAKSSGESRAIGPETKDLTTKTSATVPAN